jgi:quercetin dioxygenase-like cupin family protein
MSNNKIWFITGASRGMGVDFAKAALEAGHSVVASGRDRDRVSKALGQSKEPGARTAWHTHPLGQTLIVTAGCGWAQRWGGPIEEIRPGDVIWFSPGEKHWHGATPMTAMTHLAIQEKKDGKVVEWMEQVSEEQYRK